MFGNLITHFSHREKTANFIFTSTISRSVSSNENSIYIQLDGLNPRRYLYIKCMKSMPALALTSALASITNFASAVPIACDLNTLHPVPQHQLDQNTLNSLMANIDTNDATLDKLLTLFGNINAVGLANDIRYFPNGGCNSFKLSDQKQEYCCGNLANLFQRVANSCLNLPNNTAVEIREALPPANIHDGIFHLNTDTYHALTSSINGNAFYNLEAHEPSLWLLKCHQWANYGDANYDPTFKRHWQGDGFLQPLQWTNSTSLDNHDEAVIQNATYYGTMCHGEKYDGMIWSTGSVQNATTHCHRVNAPKTLD